MQWMISEREGDYFALSHVELGNGTHVFAVKGDTGHELDCIWPGHRVYSIVTAAHPGDVPCRKPELVRTRSIQHRHPGQTRRVRGGLRRLSRGHRKAA